MADEYVTIAGQRLDVDGAIGAVDLTPLAVGRGGVRGGDLTVETLDGDVPRGRVRASWNVPLAFNVFGDVDLDGVARSGTRRRQALANVADLRDLLLAPYTPGPTIKLVYRLDDGNELEGDVIIGDMPTTAHDDPRIGRVIRIVLDIVVPAGQLTVVAV